MTRLLIFAFAVATLRPAHAGDGVEVHLQVKPLDQADAKQRGKAPTIEATVIGGPKLPLDKYTISTQAGAKKVTLDAEKLREYSEGNETIAIALVIGGQEIWMGNNEYEQDENARYAGVFKRLSLAIDKANFGNAGPPGSKGMVVAYSTGAEIKVPMGDLKRITGAALGSQKDYRGKIGNDMLQGIALALAELSKTSTARKALIVIGGRNDTFGNAARAVLAVYKKDAARQNIQTFAIVYGSDGGSEVASMVPGARTVNSIDGIAAELDRIIARMADRIYVTFPGYVAATKQGLPWDGNDHDLVIALDHIELEPVTLALAPKWSPPTTGGFPWLVVILAGLGAIVLLVIAVRVFSGKK